MKRMLVLAWLVAALAGWTFWTALVAAEEPAKNGANEPEAKLAAEEGTKFLRVQRDEAPRPAAMDTAVARYASPGRPGVEIDLVGAVHVGDREYYDALNELFTKYDVVLYELVAPEGTRIPKGGRKGPSTHPIGALQEGMGAVLELEHQLDCVDYHQPNLVHADMSPAEFQKAMADRKESFLQMFLRLVGAGMAQSSTGNGANDLDILMALFSKDRATKLKTLMAEQFELLDAQLAVLDGPGGSAILTERNKRCFEVLDKQLAAGKKKIAIFYGAAHLPDMERRLVGDHGFKLESVRWLPAWRLQKPAAGSK
jgi:hypothetical protein